MIQHQLVQEYRILRTIILHKSPHHCVPRKPIWVLDIAKDTEGVVNVDEGRLSGELEESTRCVSVSDVPREDQLRENLVELLEVVASSQEGL